MGGGKLVIRAIMACLEQIPAGNLSQDINNVIHSHIIHVKEQVKKAFPAGGKDARNEDVSETQINL
jgi:hypothetical protein